MCSFNRKKILNWLWMSVSSNKYDSIMGRECAVAGENICKPEICGRESFLIFLMVFHLKEFQNVEQNDELVMSKSAFLESFSFSNEMTNFLAKKEGSSKTIPFPLWKLSDTVPITFHSTFFQTYHIVVSQEEEKRLTRQRFIFIFFFSHLVNAIWLLRTKRQVSLIARWVYFTI